jgi:hypothetical protein
MTITNYKKKTRILDLVTLDFDIFSYVCICRW